MTGSGWLALGAAIGALAAPEVGALVVGLAAAGLALALTAARPARSTTAERDLTWARARVLLPVALGSLALAVRILAGGDAPASTPTLPDGRGPWTATVESKGSNREGQQVATVRIGGAPDASWLVAASLPRYPVVEPGDIVSIDGAIEGPPDGPYGDYLERIGVTGTIRARQLTVAGRADGPAASLERLRRAAADALAAAIPEPEAGLAAGIVIGLRDRVDRDLAADFTTVGASHVVAISGWNIAIVAATVAALVGRLGRRLRTLVMVPTILLYVLFAGASPSVVRAAAMAGVVLLARETGRAGRAAAALGWAAAILLCVEPSLVRDVGFQLSTLATAGILAWADPIERRLRGLGGGRVPAWLAELLAVSLAAQAATLPVVLEAFGRLAVISPAINLAIVPLVAPAMAASLIALAGGGLVLAGGPAVIATLAGLPAWGLLTLICTIVAAGARLPFASVTLEPPWSTALAAALVALPIAVAMARRRRGRSGRASSSSGSPALPVDAPSPVRSREPAAASPQLARLSVLALAVAVGSLGLAFAHREDGVARITVLDVGQGDAILVEGGRGGRLLVDGGPDPDRLLVELDRRLPPWDRRLDVVVLTHPHEDHVAGLPLLLERYRVGRVFESGMRGPGPGYAAFARDLQASRAPPIASLATGGRIAIDGIVVRVLWPDPGRVPREPPDTGRAINDASIVLLGEVSGRRFLLTGDVEDDVDPILASRGLPPIDVLKVAHHGSATASTTTFLDAVRPRIAIVSAGADNPYGHPARSTVERVAATGARVLRTDRDGSVSVSIDPAGVIRTTTSGARAARTAPPTAPRLASAADASTMPPTPPRLPAPAVGLACGIPSG